VAAADPRGSEGEERTVKTPAERKEEARQQKLEEIQEQVESGSLVIRPMTKQERRRFPPKPRPPRSKQR
jgi:hypothetical protein